MLFNPTIFESRTLLMQRLADAVSHGYTHYCSGTVTIDRCAKLARKFDLNYVVSADRNERARRKLAGLGNATLLLWLRDGSVHWWLMVAPPSAGEHPAHAIESLRDATKSMERVQIDGFELVRLPRKARKIVNPTVTAGKATAPSRKQKSTTLTWRMQAEKYQGWRDSIIQSVRGSSYRSIEELLYRLWSSPGFSGIRTQVGNIVALYRGEVKRSGRKDTPPTPKHLRYVRRLSTAGISLAELHMRAKSAGHITHPTSMPVTAPGSADQPINPTAQP
jgi:hypothetical protein